MPLIIVVTIIIYSILIGWAWTTLGDTDKTKKIIIIFIEVLAISIITLIVFAISKNGINYTSKEAQNDIRNVIVIIFTGINALLVIPYLNKQIMNLKNNESDEKIVIRKLIALFIIFVICIIFECGYMNDTQKGIIKMEQVYLEQNKN